MRNDTAEIEAHLTLVNRGRLRLLDDAQAEDLAAAEHSLEERFRPSVKLAVYGTLAPGKVNHHHVAGLGGRWHGAAVRGRIERITQGIHRGLPAIRLDPAVQPHPVRLLESLDLPSAWDRLDAFEGAEMQRLLVPLESAGGVQGVANIYALRRAMLEVLG